MQQELLIKEISQKLEEIESFLYYFIFFNFILYFRSNQPRKTNDYCKLYKLLYFFSFFLGIKFFFR